MRIGFIGAGNVARSHLANFDDIDDVSIAAVCDVDHDRAREAAAPRDAAVYEDHETLYEAQGSELDAVAVCIPPFAHTTEEIMAAERGIPLLVEKPLALSMEHAVAVRDAIADAGVLSQVCYQRRYHPAVERAKAILGDREIVLIDGQRQCSVPETGWWRHEDRSGGQIVEMTTHDFDLTRHFAGEIDSVAARGTNQVVEEIDFPDATATTIAHETGAISDLSATSASPEWNSDFTIVAEDARLTFDYFEGWLRGVVDGEEIEFEAADAARARLDRAFVKAVREDDPGLLRSPYSDAINTLEATLAATEALETNREISL